MPQYIITTEIPIKVKITTSENVTDFMPLMQGNKVLQKKIFASALNNIEEEFIELLDTGSFDVESCKEEKVIPCIEFDNSLSAE